MKSFAFTDHVERKKFQEEKETYQRERRPTSVVAGIVNDIIIIENDD
jgi:hypothetical protein